MVTVTQTRTVSLGIFETVDELDYFAFEELGYTPL